jgi:hypothetical protein
MKEKYRMIINVVSDYVHLLVRIAHIICNHSVFLLHSVGHKLIQISDHFIVPPLKLSHSLMN